jgi:hypothetical protein
MTREHETISNNFVKRLVTLLGHEDLKIESYSIDSGEYSGERETIRLNIDRFFQLNIQVLTRK